MNASNAENIRVFVRCRPLNSQELSHSSSLCISTTSSPNELALLSNDPHKPSEKLFVYDGIFGLQSTQEQVYEECAFSLIENLFEGYNATIFAYGQTGSGKTYSMVGDVSNQVLKGITPRSFEHIMSLINGNSEGRTFFITASFMEIYNEEIHDLLRKTPDKKPVKCEIRENADKGFYVKDISQTVVHSVQELLNLLEFGNSQRAVGETLMNQKSSRSHSIFNVRVESSVEIGPGIKPKISVGKLNLVDLAGSERQNKTQAQNERFKEAIKINLSLSALGNVISALADGKTSHIPYRDSKLTRLLQDSLGGNAKTVMLANVNPSILHYEETLGTLRYASRTKMIKNKPKMNEDPKDALIRNYLDEIQKLKEMLERNAGGVVTVEKPAVIDPEVLSKMMEDGKQEKEKALREMEELKEKEFEDFKQRELKEKEKIIEELKEKEEGYVRMKLDKEKLEEMLKEKEQALLQGHQIQEDKTKLEDMRKRIIKHQKMQDELIQEKKRQEEELRIFERKYANIQEELLALRKSNKELYGRFSNQQAEIDDLNREHEKEKENLLDTIREQEKEISFFDELLSLLISKEQLIKIRGQSIWSENLNQYKIPPYLFKDKEVKLPFLTHTVGVDIVGLDGQPRTLRDIDEETNLPILEAKRRETQDTDPEERKDKEGFLTSQRIKTSNSKVSKRVKIRPVKISHPMTESQPKEIGPPPILKKPSYQSMISIEDMTSPSLAERTKMKKEYLSAIDNMIDAYTEKYGKEKVIVPQNLSMNYNLSFTSFNDLERDLDTQMAKAKRNLNTLLEPLPAPKSEAVINELIDENPLFKRKMPIEKNSALINKRVPLSPKSIALSALHRIPGSSMNASQGPYFLHRKFDSEVGGIISNNKKNEKHSKIKE